MKTKDEKPVRGEIIIRPVQTEEATLCVVGPASPRKAGIYYNCVAEKARRELLYPHPRGTRPTTIKHDPLAEYQASIYRSTAGPTLILVPGGAFKSAMMRACSDVENAPPMSEFARLVSVVDEYVPVWGVPELAMDIVRMADMKKTPDVRTWAMMPEWACSLTLEFVKPNISMQAIANLLTWAGQTVGVGDGRKEKKRREHGSFRICNADDPDYLRIMAAGGREAQLHAMAHPAFHDPLTEDLFTWHLEEGARRKEQGDRREAEKAAKAAAKATKGAHAASMAQGQPS